jgi:hypothetical protein
VAPPGGGWYHFRLLLRRSTTSYVRNPGNLLARVGVTAVCALLHGLAFRRLDGNDVQNRCGGE